MTVILIISGALAVVGLILWAFDRHSSKSAPDTDTDADAAATADEAEGCCGMHITCEKDSLLASVSETIDYFDDEELDRFCGREADTYTDVEIEEFRDVLLTLLPDDIAPWARSIQLRGIVLPAPVKEELMLIVAEARAARNRQ